jgi:ubiquinone/menaquinone biosynthesis C-methylase UbiE
MSSEHPVFASIYDFLMAPQEYLGMAQTRAKVVSGLRGKVLEIGVGTGLNLGHYHKDATVVGIEPEMPMLIRAMPRRDAAAAKVVLVAADGETLPFRTGSFDAVVSTLVFCTIPDPRAALAEVRRVMKPNGTFHFLEHVLARTPWLSSFQNRIEPMWMRMFGGCHPNRATIDLFREGGFKVEKFDESKRGVIIRGQAIRS